MTIAAEQFAKWQELSKRDDWHLHFVGSDIRQMLGEIDRLRKIVKSKCRHECRTHSGTAWHCPECDMRGERFGK